jgi:small subunit ribosomal protein S9
MADKKKSLADLGALTSEPVETPAAEVETAEAPAAAEASEGETAVAETPAREARGKDAPDDQGISTQGPQIQAVLREQQLDKHGRAYATGQDRHQRARPGGLFCPPVAAPGDQPAVRPDRPHRPV